MTPKLVLKPKPELQSSYSLMMQNLECLVPTKAPAPCIEDINKASSVLETVFPPERKDRLKELIHEVKPGEIMPPDVRLGWLYKIKRLLPDIPVPELDSTFANRMK